MAIAHRNPVSRRLSLTAACLAPLWLAACGGGGGGGGNDTILGDQDDGPDIVETGGDSGPPAGSATGVLLDAEISGVSYDSESFSGLTDSSGRFYYAPGEQVTFKIGDIVLGTVLGAPIVTPVYLTGASTPEEDRVINMLRFLVTLDEDGNPDNGITIPEAIRNAALGQGLDFNQSTTQFDKDVKLVNALSAMGIGALVPVKTAAMHFDATLKTFWSTLSGIYEGTFSGGNSGEWKVDISEEGVIIGEG